STEIRMVHEDAVDPRTQHETVLALPVTVVGRLDRTLISKAEEEVLRAECPGVHAQAARVGAMHHRRRPDRHTDLAQLDDAALGDTDAVYAMREQVETGVTPIPRIAAGVRAADRFICRGAGPLGEEDELTLRSRFAQTVEHAELK